MLDDFVATMRFWQCLVVLPTVVCDDGVLDNSTGVLASPAADDCCEGRPIAPVPRSLRCWSLSSSSLRPVVSTSERGYTGRFVSCFPCLRRSPLASTLSCLHLCFVFDDYAARPSFSSCGRVLLDLSLSRVYVISSTPLVCRLPVPSFFFFSFDFLPLSLFLFYATAITHVA